MQRQIYNLTFCDEYKYPKEVKNQLQNILEQFNLKDIRSILLIGSTCRGELSYFHCDGKLVLLSDFEIIAVVEEKIKIEEITKLKFHHLESQFYPDSPFFHIDCGFLKANKLKKLPKTVLFYEAKQNGIVLYGDDIRDIMPEVTIDNLDLSSVNELILFRLWSMLLYTPQNLLLNRISSYEYLIFKYVQCRNALDIPTILLPNIGVLLPNYQQRVKYINDKFERLRCAKYFDEKFPSFLSDCLKAKYKVTFSQSTIELFRSNLQGYTSLLKFLLHTPTNTDLDVLCERIIESPSKLFNPMVIRRNIYEFISNFKNLDRMRLLLDYRSFFRKRQLLIALLLYMHYALLMKLMGNNGEAVGYVEKAEFLLKKIVFSSIEDLHDMQFAEKWLHLRRLIAGLMIQLYRFHKEKEYYFNSVLEWSHE